MLSVSPFLGPSYLVLVDFAASYFFFFYDFQHKSVFRLPSLSFTVSY